MLRNALVKNLRGYGGVLSPVLLVAGLLLVFLLPIVKPLRLSIDENAIGHMTPSLPSIRVPHHLDLEVRGHRQLVRGKRSPGTESIAVYVNTAFNSSVAVANILIEALRAAESLGCDVEFIFSSGSEPTSWRIPTGFTRAALVVNISSLKSTAFCLDIHGAHGLQPNQDLVSTFMQAALSLDIDISFLCQVPQKWTSTHPVGYYIQAMEAAIRLPLFPQGWHHVPIHGISTLAISTNGHHVHQAVTSRAPERIVNAFLSAILLLNGLEEKFHHATFVWVPAGPLTYVSFDMAQFGIFLFAGSIIACGYAVYQRDGAYASLSTAAILSASSALSAQACHVAGWPGLTAVSLLLALILSPRKVGLVWISLNAVALILLEALHPLTGLLAGAGITAQLTFLNPLLEKRSIVLVPGVAVSWAIYYYLVWHLQLPLWSTRDVSDSFVTFFAYPNALLLSSRLLHLLRTYVAGS